MTVNLLTAFCYENAPPGSYELDLTPADFQRYATEGIIQGGILLDTMLSYLLGAVITIEKPNLVHSGTSKGLLTPGDHAVYVQFKYTEETRATNWPKPSWLSSQSNFKRLIDRTFPNGTDTVINFSSSSGDMGLLIDALSHYEDVLTIDFIRPDRAVTELHQCNILMRDEPLPGIHISSGTKNFHSTGQYPSEALSIAAFKALWHHACRYKVRPFGLKNQEGNRGNV